MDDPDYALLDEPGAPQLADLVAYWERKRAGRAMPRRADIDPLDLARHLSHLCLLDVLDGGADFRIRLVGTAIVAALGYDGTGWRLGERFRDRPEVLARVVERINAAVQRKRPVYSCGRMFWHASRAYRGYVAVTLPLSADGATVDIVMIEMLMAGSPDATRDA